MPDDRPPFDPLRAAFMLVAFVLVVQCLIALAGSVGCFVHFRDAASGQMNCDPNNRLSDLLTAALAAALALMAGFTRKP